VARAKTKAKKKDPRKALIDAAMKLAAEGGWRGLAMADIAEAAGLSLAEALEIFPHKSAILSGLAKDVDAALLRDLAADQDMDGTAKDRLFDVIMRRFDALEPHKDGLAAVLMDLPCDPLAGICQALRLHCSMALTLEAAGLSSAGVGGLMRIKGLSLVYANGLRVWFRDESNDMAATMAAVDRGLIQADRLARLCCPSRTGEPANGEPESA